MQEATSKMRLLQGFLRRLCCLKCDAAFVVDVAQGAVRLHRNYRILPNGTNGLDLMFAG
jgi:hypothetical protein